ncbi:MAG: NmrA family NAD(P)-binding protein, partial [Alphaproteobacteria bacterium]|nr:NmrA family NAD(P)-binding protein [Alphaproteobacteria bacterium]
AGIENVVFSTKHSANKLTGNTLKVPHLELKSQVEAYARKKFEAAIFVHMNFYYQNFLAWFLPRPGEDGDLAFGFPQGDTPMAAANVEDLGGVVNAIFDRPGDFAGRVVGIVGDDLRGKEYARIMSEATGRMIKYNYIPRDVFASFDFPGADILANMFEMNRLYILDSQTDLAECRKLYPEMQSFDGWAANNTGGLVAGADG